MAHFSIKSFRFSVIIVLLVLSTIACGITTDDDPQEDIAIQLTTIALQQTQTAVVLPPTSAPPAQEEVPTQPTLPPTDIPTPTPDVDFQGISFSFDDSIASGVSPAIIPAQNMGEDFMPMETYPEHYQFELNGYALSDTFHDPIIRVYPVQTYLDISQQAADNFLILETLLANRNLSTYDGYFPFLPIWNAAMIFHTKTDYVAFQNGDGIRFLTMFGQALYPLDNTNVFYTYQGLTNDGNYYVSAVLPISNPILPDNGDYLMEDYMAFQDNWDNYLAETLQLLNAQPLASFGPRIDILDQMINSISINK